MVASTSSIKARTILPASTVVVPPNVSVPVSHFVDYGSTPATLAIFVPADKSPVAASNV